MLLFIFSIKNLYFLFLYKNPLKIIFFVFFYRETSFAGPPKEPEVSPSKEPEVSPSEEPEASPSEESEASPSEESEVSFYFKLFFILIPK